MKKSGAVVGLMISLFLVTCDTANTSTESKEIAKVKAKLVEADAEFSLDLFKKVVELEEESANQFISPLSVSTALGMTMNGAVGTTRNEMAEVLKFGDLTEDEINAGYKSLIEELTSADELVKMEVANSVWTREGFNVREEFYSVLRTYFEAEAQVLDFDNPESADIINGWVSDKTHEKIESVIERIETDIVMYLINAVYFKGSWLYSFNAESTKEMGFLLDDGSNTRVQMMNQKNKVPFYIDDAVHVLDLPYGDGRFSMTFIRPADDTPIRDFIKEDLTSENLYKWFGAVQSDTLNFYVPKLELEYSKTLNHHLIEMGMPTAFSGSADFSGISPGGGINISEVLHKTYVNIDEEGTEAAGVTVVSIIRTSAAPDPTPTIKLDRSYVMILREKETGAILFMGAIGKPEAEITD